MSARLTATDIPSARAIRRSLRCAQPHHWRSLTVRPASHYKVRSARTLRARAL